MNKNNFCNLEANPCRSDDLSAWLRRQEWGLMLRRSGFDWLVRPTNGWPSRRDERSFKES